MASADADSVTSGFGNCSSGRRGKNGYRAKNRRRTYFISRTSCLILNSKNFAFLDSTIQNSEKGQENMFYLFRLLQYFCLSSEKKRQIKKTKLLPPPTYAQYFTAKKYKKK